MAFSWKGYSWEKRSDSGAPMYNGQWSTANVADPDGNNYVKLSLTNPGSSPTGAEFYSVQEGWGYGTYTCVVSGSLSTMHKCVVFGGMFTYDDSATAPVTNNEIDACETSAWGEVGDRYVSHTYWIDNNGTKEYVERALAIPSDTVQTHVMIWQPGMITFRSYIGTGTGGTKYMETIRTDNIPTPNNEKVYFNLWVFDTDAAGTADADAATAIDVYIRDFSYSTDVVAPPTPPSSSQAIGSYSLQMTEAYYGDVTEWTHTCAGDNRLLIVGISTLGDGGPPAAYTVTYNGVAMTMLRDDLDGNVKTEIWYLVNPPVGTFSISADCGTGYINSHAIFFSQSFYGVDQLDPFDGDSANTVQPLSTSITTTVNNVLMYDVACKYSTSNALTAGSGQTATTDSNGSGWGIYAGTSTKAAATAGSQTMGWTWTDSQDGVHSVVAIKQFTANNSGGFLSMLL